MDQPPLLEKLLATPLMHLPPLPSKHNTRAPPTMASSVLNRQAASALASSVLPTPAAVSGATGGVKAATCANTEEERKWGRQKGEMACHDDDCVGTWAEQSQERKPIGAATSNI